MNSNNNVSVSPFRRLLLMLKPDRDAIKGLYAFALISGLISLSLPLGIQAIVNFIQVGQISASFILLVVIVVGGVTATGILQIFQIRITEHLQQQIFTRAAFEFAYRIPKLKWTHLYREYAPELMNRFFDVLTLQKGLSKILLDFTTASLQIILGLLLLSFYHPIFIGFGVALVVLVYLIFRATANKGMSTSLEESKHKYQLVYWLEELARTATTFKMAGETELPVSRTDRHVVSYLTARKAHFEVLVSQYWYMVLFKVLMVMGLLALGGVLVMNQMMNIGQFIAAEIIILLVIGSVEKLILSFETIYDILTAISKIAFVTDLDLDRNDQGKLLEPCEEGFAINFEDVSFSYPNQKQLIFNQLNLKIAAGEKVLLHGENGSGKSTLLRIIAGLYQAEGRISYDGVSFHHYNPEEFWSFTGDALNHELIFQGTIEENITLGRKQVDQARLNEVTELVGITDFLRELPLGLRFVLDPEGKRIPEGVRQKIILARAIVHKPRLLILENSLEYLLGSEKDKLIEYLTDDSNGWTLIVVSNDNYWNKKVSRIGTVSGSKISWEEN